MMKTLLKMIEMAKLRKLNNYSDAAVREASVSRYNGGPIEGSPETPRTSQHYHFEGLKGALNWSPIMPRDPSLSDSQCKFFQCVEALMTGSSLRFEGRTRRGAVELGGRSLYILAKTNEHRSTSLIALLQATVQGAVTQNNLWRSIDNPEPYRL